MDTELREMVDKEVALSSVGEYICPEGHINQFNFWNCSRPPVSNPTRLPEGYQFEGRVLCKDCNRLYGVSEIEVPIN